MIKRVVFNQKGGVGKTTIVCNLAAIAAQRGRRTLVVDLDTQANATQYLLGRRPASDAGIGPFFEASLGFSLQSPTLNSAIVSSPLRNLDVIPASPALEELIVRLEAKQKIYKLRDALGKLKQYDEIYIDTPPALNFYSRSALIAADRVLIPFDCDEFARQALYTLIDNLNELRADHNEALELEGIVVNQFQPRARLPQRMVDELREEGLPILEQTLGSSVIVRESHEQHLPLVFLDEQHKLSRDYAALYTALSAR